MTEIPTDREVKIRLDGRKSQEVLSSAVQQGRTIDIYADPEVSVVLLNGLLVDSNDSHLFICVHCENATEMAMNALSTLHAEFTLDGMVYRLETSELDDLASGEEHLVRIPRPEFITRVERRRSRRYGFRRTTDVEIALGRNGQGERLQGLLLNLSVDGLACKVSNAEAVRLATYQTVTVTFRISGGHPPLVLTGRVASRTPGGSQGCTVIGVEFDEQTDVKQRERVIGEVRDRDGTKDQDVSS